MKNSAVIGAVVAAGVAAGVAAFVTRSRSDNPVVAGGEPAGAPVIKGLGDSPDAAPALVNSVSTLIVKSGANQFTIQKNASGAWEMAEKGGYPVALDKVKQAIVQLAELRTVEPKTSKPENYSKLGVQEPGPSAAPATPAAPGERESVLLTLKDSAGKDLASVIVGNPKYSGNEAGVYIRRAGEAQSWLAKGALEVPAQATGWMETKILEVPRDRLKAATVTQADGSAVSVFREKPADANFTVKDIPPGRELKSANAGDALGAAIAFIGFDDVAPASTIPLEGEGALKPKWTADFRSFDGLVLVIQAFGKDGKTWVRFLPTFDDTSTAPTENRPPALKPAEDVLKEVEALKSGLTPWVFILPDWKLPSLNTTMNDFVKPPPAAPTSPTGMTGAPAAPPPPGAPMVVPPPQPSPPPASNPG